MKATVITLGLLGLLLLGAWLFGENGRNSLAPKSGAQLAREAAGEANAKAQAAAKERQWQTVLHAGNAIRATMRNPDSIVYEDVRANDDASVMCFQYRAQNGFGGMNRETMAIVNGVPSQASAIWNTHCTKYLDVMSTALWQLNRK